MPRFVLLLLTLLAPLSAHAQRTVTEADGTRTLIVETWVPAAPGAVWQAVSAAEGWESWAVPHAWLTGDLLETSYRPGGTRGDPANIQQRIVSTVAGSKFVFRTVRTPPGFPHAQAYLGVTSVFDLTPEGSGTRVRLTSTNYPAGGKATRCSAFSVLGTR